MNREGEKGEAGKRKARRHPDSLSLFRLLRLRGFSFL
jgi:hypothetical protein